MINLKKIDKSWTLFLDRDGVINNEKHMDYINTWDEFKFFPGVKEAIKKFTEKFGNIFIITNQRGVAKGLTKLEDLEIIQKNLLKKVAIQGEKVTKIIFFVNMKNSNQNLKPIQAWVCRQKKNFPCI